MAATIWAHKLKYHTTAGNLHICWVSGCASLDPATGSGTPREPSAADHKLLWGFRNMPVTCGDLGRIRACLGSVSVNVPLTLMSVIPRILAGNKERLAAADSGGLRAGPTMRPGRAGCCARLLVASSAPMHG